MVSFESEHGDALGINHPPGTVQLINDYTNEVGEPLEIIRLPVPTNDPNDPLNWPTWRKLVNFAFVFAFSVAIFTTITIQVIFWQQMEGDMNVTYAELNYSLAVQSVGLSVGCLFFIPFTKKYGRRSSYVLSTAVLAGMYWWTAKMKTTAELYITNLFLGMASALNETMSQMTVADLFFIHHRGAANAVYMIAVVVGSALTPIPAGVQAAAQGWRMSYIVAATFMSALSIAALFCFEETKYVPVVTGVDQGISDAVADDHPKKEDYDTDVKDVKEATGRDSIAMEKQAVNSVPPMNTYWQRMRLCTKTDESLWQLFIAPWYTMMLPAVAFSSLQYAAVVAWLTIEMSIQSEYFAAPPYNFSTAQVGYLDAATFIGTLFGSLYCGLLGDWLIKYCSKRNKGIYEPEMRLYLLGLPVLCISGGMIMYGATIDRSMHWIVPQVGCALFAFGMGGIGDASFCYVIDSYRELTGEAFVIVSFWRNVISIAVPFAIANGTAIGLTNMFIVIGVVAFACGITFIPMIVWGKRCRARYASYYWKLVVKFNATNRR